MASSFQTSVFTPEGKVFEGPADFVTIPAYDGEVGILRNRAPLLAKLGAGRLRIVSAGKEEIWYIGGGFAQVLDNHVTILTQQAMSPEKIDRAAAESRLLEARRMKPTDDLAAKRKGELESAARAQLRLAK